jgi:hypothetical protein
VKAPPVRDHGAGAAAPAFLVSYSYTFEDALEAGRFFQARLYRWYLVTLGIGLLAGAMLMINGVRFGLTIVLACAALLLMARFAVMDRLFARRRLRSLIGRKMALELSDHGIAWSGRISTGQMPWTSVAEVRANAKTVLWVGDRLLLAYAPAKAFPTPEDRFEAIAYSRRQVAATRAGDAPTSPAKTSAPG